jgi:hypothetical protein
MGLRGFAGRYCLTCAGADLGVREVPLTEDLMIELPPLLPRACSGNPPLSIHIIAGALNTTRADFESRLADEFSPHGGRHGRRPTLRPDPMIFTGLLIPSIVRQANGVDMR